MIIDTLKTELNTTYSDFNFDFSTKQNNDDISILYGQDAIKNAIKNICLSGWNEMPFKPKVGSGILGLVGGELSKAIAKYIEDILTTQINNNDSRVELESVIVKYDNTKLMFGVTISYIFNRIPFDFAIYFSN